MEINRDSIDKLLSLNDRQLMTIIGNLAKESGIDPAEFNLDPRSIDSIRRALRGASDDDLKKIAEQYEANKTGKKGR